MAVEGDYVLERLWRNEALARSSATSHVAGGAVYARYQLTQKLGVAARAEYLSDRGGLFSGLTQALKETTATLDYKLDDGFLMRYEWRRDFSNQRSFLTDAQGILSKTKEYCKRWPGMVVRAERRNMVSASAACKRRSVP